MMKLMMMMMVILYYNCILVVVYDNKSNCKVQFILSDVLLTLNYL
jgi:hypothetical protein